MKNRVLLILPIYLGLALTAPAQVPQIIQYQGRLTIHNVAFQGEGLFRFALVNSNGQVSFWSNDQSSSHGSAPLTAVPLLVNRGTYSVVLGDTSLSNMVAIPPTVFTNSDVRLRIWFDDGQHGSQLLSPDQRIAAVGYAMVAASAASVARGAITPASLAPGTALANLLAGGQSPVPSGGLILSREPDSPSLAAAGFVPVGSLIQTVAEHWEPRATFLEGRQQHSAVWTGSEHLVWGGGGAGTYFNNGGRYNPENNSWQPITTSNAPAGRWEHGAVWSGQEMIIWGGRSAFNHTDANLNTGGRYDPISNVWRSITTDGAPTARSKPVVVWTGSEMLVWGGVMNGGICLSNGGRYNPASDTWTPITTNGAPRARADHVAVWTGTEMIVWGGFVSAGIVPFESLGDGARYNPALDQWTPLPAAGVPRGSSEPVAIWTGQEMIVWGGIDYGARTALGEFPTLATGARYNPVANQWRPISATNVPIARAAFPGVWTGHELIVWGGSSHLDTGNFTLNNGARYNPNTDTWSALTDVGAPAARANSTMIWTGKSLLIFGGLGGADLPSQHAWTPGNGFYLYQRP